MRNFIEAILTHMKWKTDNLDVALSSRTKPSDNQKITIWNTPSADAFGRLRVSEPFGVFDSKQISSNDPYNWEEKLVGTATDTYQYNRSSTYLAIGTASWDRAVRQSTRYFPYVPGKSHSIACTGIFAVGKTNLNQYIGYGDDLNGLFFKLQGTIFWVCTRTASSGTAVDTFTPQSSWNIDKLDGTWISGITLDITKAQIFLIDFQWLGVGRVRFSLDIDGVVIPIHEMNNANVSSVVFMKTPTLPVRYEIVNTGITASTSTLEQICCSVSSEWGYQIPGIEFSAGHGVTRRTVTTTRIPILAVRLKNEFPTGKPNRRTLRFLDFSATVLTNDIYLELRHIHNPSAITATWADVDDSSGIEYSTNISALTAAHSHLVQPVMILAWQAGKWWSEKQSAEFINNHSYVSQNFDSTNSEMFVIYGTSVSGNAEVSAHLSWVESE